jgi:molybdate transport system substrate-binding protein
MYSKLLSKSGLIEDGYNVYQFTQWVIATQLGNPKNINGLEDLLRDYVIVYTSSKATISEIIALPYIEDLIKRIYDRSAKDFDCYRKMLKSVVNEDCDAAIVEKRCTTLKGIDGNIDIIEIPAKYVERETGFFTIGVIENSENKDLAYKYKEFVLSYTGQKILEKNGFIPINSKKGREILYECYPEHASITPIKSNCNI